MVPNGRAVLRRFGLSKSKIAAFEQCPKRLWLEVHRPQEAAFDDDTKARFSAGHEVGALACALVPDGIMVEADPDIQAALRTTAALIASDERWPIFEATFERDGVLVRVDIMMPENDGSWHVAEVKSTTSSKAYQLNDLATQIWVVEGAGINIASASIRHIDRQFIYRGDGNYQGLLIDAPADHIIAPIIATRADIASRARETLQGPEPQREIGTHCTDPFSCQFQAYCARGKTIPEWPISLLPNSGRRLAESWREKGAIALADIKANDLKNPLHQRIHQATLSGLVYHDVEGARAATRGWPFPRAWLDFETIAFAIPHWAGTRPYEQVPFQYSLHVEQTDGTMAHHEFLSLDGSDPRAACAEALIASVPADGAIIAYNASFERSCLRNLAEQCPALRGGLLAIADRLVDLQPVARNHWYHRDQKGSWSIKAVLPTINAGLGYDELAIKEGGAAQLAYVEAIDPTCDPVRKAEIDRALRDYCRRDTEAMIALYRTLAGASASQ